MVQLQLTGEPGVKKKQHADVKNVTAVTVSLAFIIEVLINTFVTFSFGSLSLLSC